MDAVPTRPKNHVHDVIVGQGDYLVWRARKDLRPGDERVFYSGDYADVLEPDDPRLAK